MIAFYTLLATLLIYALLLLRRTWKRFKAKLRREPVLQTQTSADN